MIKGQLQVHATWSKGNYKHIEVSAATIPRLLPHTHMQSLDRTKYMLRMLKRITWACAPNGLCECALALGRGWGYQFNSIEVLATCRTLRSQIKPKQVHIPQGEGVCPVASPRPLTVLRHGGGGTPGQPRTCEIEALAAVENEIGSL